MFLLKPESMNAKTNMHREYKLETVKLPRERGVSVAQGACNPDVHEVTRVRLTTAIWLDKLAGEWIE